MDKTQRQSIIDIFDKDSAVEIEKNVYEGRVDKKKATLTFVGDNAIEFRSLSFTGKDGFEFTNRIEGCISKLKGFTFTHVVSLEASTVFAHTV